MSKGSLSYYLPLGSRLDREPVVRPSPSRVKGPVDLGVGGGEATGGTRTFWTMIRRLPHRLTSPPPLSPVCFLPSSSPGSLRPPFGDGSPFKDLQTQERSPVLKDRISHFIPSFT